jgi:acetamidase/formamidase
MEVELGEAFVVECHSYGQGVIWKRGDEETDHTGKLCQPIWINGVQLGDTIAVHIEKIDIVGNGCACIDGPLKWNKGFPLEDANYFIPIRDSTAILPGGIKEEIRPSLGHINVEPVERIENPWHCGGNMDLGETCEGNTIYLRAEKEGAKLVLGDSKAHVVEGEIAGEGIQAALDVTLRVTKSESIHVQRPFVETPAHWIAVGMDKNYWDAVKLATQDLIEIVQNLYGLDYEAAYFWVTHFSDARNGAIWLMGGQPPPHTFNIPRTVTLYLKKNAEMVAIASVKSLKSK